MGRDSRQTAAGENHATHMLIGMQFASTLVLMGSPVKPMVIPWMINRNGQAITLANGYKGRVKAAKDLGNAALGNYWTQSVDYVLNAHVALSSYGGYAPGGQVAERIYPRGKNAAVGYVELTYKS